MSDINAINEIAAALAAAQAEMSNPMFDSSNPHFRSRFASLAAVRNSVVPVLARHGIAVVQDLIVVAEGIACTTKLLHASGQTLSCGPLVIPASKPDAQGLGSSATYARRYALMAIAGVVGDDDEDGERAVNRGTNGHAKESDERISEGQQADIASLMDEVGADRKKFLAYFKLASIADMKASDYARAVQALQRKRES